jgi:hypothetical protein
MPILQSESHSPLDLGMLNVSPLTFHLVPNTNRALAFGPVIYQSTQFFLESLYGYSPYYMFCDYIEVRLYFTWASKRVTGSIDNTDNTCRTSGLALATLCRARPVSASPRLWPATQSGFQPPFFLIVRIPSTIPVHCSSPCCILLTCPSLRRVWLLGLPGHLQHPMPPQHQRLQLHVPRHLAQ